MYACKIRKSEELFIRQKYILNLWKKKFYRLCRQSWWRFQSKYVTKTALLLSERKVLVIKLQIIMLYKNSRRHISAFNYDADFLCVLFIGVDENYARQKHYGGKKKQQHLFASRLSIFSIHFPLYESSPGELKYLQQLMSQQNGERINRSMLGRHKHKAKFAFPYRHTGIFL